MHHFFRRFVLFFILAVMSQVAIAETRITSFESRITVRSDGTLAVVEHLDVMFEGNAPRHGIYRDLLLSYTDLSGSAHSAAYEIQSVRVDGGDEPWNLRRQDDSLRITIGDPDAQRQPGSARYELRYVTDYQLAFDSQTDSLYWNVTGHAATLPIDQVNVVVGFPAGVEDIEFTAMTGVQGSRERDVRARQQEGLLEVQTLQPLAPGEGLTLHVRWPAGAVMRPEGGERFRQPAASGSLQGVLRMVFGNGLALLGAIALVLFGLRRRYAGAPDDASVREMPPENLSPAAMRWVDRRRVDSRCLAAAIVSLAAKGRIQIVDLNKGHSGMTFSRTGAIDGPALSRGEVAVLTTLFERGDEVRAHRGFEREFSAATGALGDAIKTEHEDALFDNTTDVLFKGIAFTCVALVAWFLLVPEAWRAPWSFFAIAVGTCVMLMWFASSTYSRTPHGEQVLNQIRAFRRYLSDDSKTRQPEVPATTERYLACAVALDESKSWANRALSGMPAPVWYTGNLFNSEDFVTAISELDRHLVRDLRSVVRSDTRGIDDEGQRGGGHRGDASGGAESGGGGGGGGVGSW